jgi:L-ascorbate peroxidase
VLLDFAGTWNAATKTGGANASIRFPSAEMTHGANAGLTKATALLDPIKAKHPKMSYADLFQYASVVGIEFTGGPTIPFRSGRIDATEADVVEEGRLPDANKAADHLRDIFYRMGLNDQEIVALSGAHCLGAAHKDRSGFDGAWTEDKLKWGNDYFANIIAGGKEGLLLLPSDKTLFEDAKMKPFVEKYAADLEAFNADYVAAHVKLSEFGFAA